MCFNHNVMMLREYCSCGKKTDYSILLPGVTVFHHWEYHGAFMCFPLHVNKAQRMRVLHQQQHHTHVVVLSIMALEECGGEDILNKVFSFVVCTQNVCSYYFLCLDHVPLLSMAGQKALRFNQKYLNLRSKDEWMSYGVWNDMRVSN